MRRPTPGRTGDWGLPSTSTGLRWDSAGVSSQGKTIDASRIDATLTRITSEWWQPPRDGSIGLKESSRR
ncbi:hypothetical protein R1flu_022818 [Riccia fluitans]|uniref:Uncharacterized protein n=1 Tax=Riccia fluitans TaxID=41844 RepID=A0ABD1XTA3_9MARC